MNLRPYQPTMSAAILDAWTTHRAVIGSPATGGGKTEFAIDIIGQLASQTSRAIVLTERRILNGQSPDRMVRHGMTDVGVIEAENTQRIWAPVVVASSQPVASHLIKHGCGLPNFKQECGSPALHWLCRNCQAINDLGDDTCAECAAVRCRARSVFVFDSQLRRIDHDPGETLPGPAVDAIDDFYLIARYDARSKGLSEGWAFFATARHFGLDAGGAMRIVSSKCASSTRCPRTTRRAVGSAPTSSASASRAATLRHVLRHDPGRRAKYAGQRTQGRRGGQPPSGTDSTRCSAGKGPRRCHCLLTFRLHRAAAAGRMSDPPVKSEAANA